MSLHSSNQFSLGCILCSECAPSFCLDSFQSRTGCHLSWAFYIVWTKEQYSSARRFGWRKVLVSAISSQILHALIYRYKWIAPAWFPGLYSSRSRGPNHTRPGKKCSLVSNLSPKLTPSQPTSLPQPAKNDEQDHYG